MTQPATQTGTPVKLMTPRELAEFLQVDPERLYEWRRKGDGPRFVKLGRDVRYRRADVHAWLEANLRSTTKDGDGS